LAASHIDFSCVKQTRSGRDGSAAIVSMGRFAHSRPIESPGWKATTAPASATTAGSPPSTHSPRRPRETSSSMWNFVSGASADVSCRAPAIGARNGRA
jgi:hypothetical protein